MIEGFILAFAPGGRPEGREADERIILSKIVHVSGEPEATADLKNGAREFWSRV